MKKVISNVGWSDSMDNLSHRHPIPHLRISAHTLLSVNLITLGKPLERADGSDICSQTPPRAPPRRLRFLRGKDYRRASIYTVSCGRRSTVVGPFAGNSGLL